MKQKEEDIALNKEALLFSKFNRRFVFWIIIFEEFKGYLRFFVQKKIPIVNTDI